MDKPSSFLKDKEWLTTKYCTMRMSCYRIAHGLGCDHKYVYYWLKKHGIQRRSISEAGAGRTYKATGKQLDHLKRLHEKQRGVPRAETTKQKCSESVSAFYILNPDARKVVADRARRIAKRGKESTQWRGGTSYSRLRWHVIKDRGPCCQYVECTWDITVDIHHIDKNRKNNQPSNLVLLCPNHHKAVHLLRLPLDYKPRGQGISGYDA